MSAQRKLIDPAIARRLAEPVEDVEGWAPRPTQPGSTSQSSPAHLLLLELSARLHQPTVTGAPASAVAAMPGEAKWPMPMRLATIGVLSVASWAMVAWAIAAVV